VNTGFQKFLYSRALLPIAGILVFALDFYTKVLAVQHLQPEGWKRVHVIPGCFDFLLARNEGAAVSIFNGRPLLIAAFSLVAIGAIVWWSLKLPREVPSSHVAMGMILGGALGNLVDRVRFHSVVDFIHWYVIRNGREYYWPTFNIADSFILIGIGLFLYLSVFTKKLEPATPTSEAKSGAEPAQV
jgi:lipoprotein signal peptidase